MALIAAREWHAADVVFLPCCDGLGIGLQRTTPCSGYFSQPECFFWLLLFFLATFVSPLFKITKTVAMD